MRLPSLDEIRVEAAYFDLDEIDYQSKNGMISFSNGKNRINIYTTTGTVMISRPNKPQLVRKDFYLDDIIAVFKYYNEHR